MNITLDSRDENYINRVNEELAAGENIPLFINQKGKEYYIKFVCDDIAKANNFIFDLIMKQNNQENEDKLGVRFLSLNYCCGDDKIQTLKSKLQNFITELDNIK